jgi:hypothetical protein
MECDIPMDAAVISVYYITARERKSREARGARLQPIGRKASIGCAIIRRDCIDVSFRGAAVRRREISPRFLAARLSRRFAAEARQAMQLGMTP